MILFYLFLFLSAANALLLALQLSTGALAIVWFVLIFLGTYLALIVLFGLVMLVSSWFVDLSKEQKERSAYYGFLVDQLLFIGLFFARVHVRTKGLEQVPRNQPFLLVSNHIYDLDPVFFIYAMPWAKLGFISKKENYSMFLINKYMHRIHCLPIDRENDRAAIKTIVRTVQILRAGKHSMGVFPEGYESKTGELLPFRNGVFKIAQKAQVPIVVAVVRGAKQVTKNMFRRPTTVELEFLGVVPPEEHTDMLTRDIGNRIHAMMEAALEQEAQK